uniref:Uncharacterized protein n=1 Tax=Bursaphelenchus xylophilus TaxID=6326 RepID=A0A1I7SA61_BURXY
MKMSSYFTFKSKTTIFQSCTSCSTLKPVPSTQPSPVKTGTDYDGSATSDTVGPASDSTTTGHSTASTPTAAGSEVETQRFICDCGNTGLSPEERDSLPPPEEANYRLTNPIQVFPIKFGAYKPMELVEAIEGPTELNPAALRPNPRPKTTRLTAFQPSLHSVYLAHHYATLIQELIENYNYL